MTAERRPIVGITTYREPASWGVWREVPAALVPDDYVRAVTAAGGRAVLLPPDAADADVVPMLDGLVLAGGADLGPDLYGATPHPHTRDRPDRDAGELVLLTAALAADLPVLGVCRGMQLLAVAHGGALHQHLPEVVGDDRHQPAPGRYGSHPVRFAPGSLLAGLLGGAVEVNSYHHQAVTDPGRLLATGWSSPDGVIEAVEDPDRRFVVGVQWHPELWPAEPGPAEPGPAVAGRPERSADARLFEALVTAAGAGR
nr:gamma-glutamyl-gamma-aminobutyrate hydrolase family protein [Micromonospora sp. DSM 115978]